MMMAQMIDLSNEALFMDGIDKLDIRECPLSLPASPEGKHVAPEGCVLVRVIATGICGSDVVSFTRVVDHAVFHYKREGVWFLKMERTRDYLVLSTLNKPQAID